MENFERQFWKNCFIQTGSFRKTCFNEWVLYFVFASLHTRLLLGTYFLCNVPGTVTNVPEHLKDIESNLGNIKSFVIKTETRFEGFENGALGDSFKLLSHIRRTLI